VHENTVDGIVDESPESGFVVLVLEQEEGQEQRGVEESLPNNMNSLDLLP